MLTKLMKSGYFFCSFMVIFFNLTHVARAAETKKTRGDLLFSQGCLVHFSNEYSTEKIGLSIKYPCDFVREKTGKIVGLKFEYFVFFIIRETNMDCEGGVSHLALNYRDKHILYPEYKDYNYFHNLCVDLDVKNNLPDHKQFYYPFASDMGKLFPKFYASENGEFVTYESVEHLLEEMWR